MSNFVWPRAELEFVYEEHFEDPVEAKSVATYFHDILVGNDDYVNNRIVLWFDERQVILSQFSDSLTKLNVVEENGRPVLEMFVPVLHSTGHIW